MNAKEQFEAADDDAALAPDEIRADEPGRSRRGPGHVDVELGKLDDAEKKYRQCLADNANDARAKQELDTFSS